MIFRRGSGAPDPAVLERLKALETQCQALSEALAARDAQLEKLRLDQLVLGRRLEEAEVQSAKAVGGLFDRLEALRSRLKTSGPQPPATPALPRRARGKARLDPRQEKLDNP